MPEDNVPLAGAISPSLMVSKTQRPILKTAGREAKMAILRGLQISGQLSRRACVPRTHCMAAITNPVKEDISLSIFRVLEADAMAEEQVSKG